MTLTETQQTIFAYSSLHEYVSLDKVEEFRQALEEDRNAQTLAIAFEDFVTATCPNCEAKGWFKYHLLGRLSHPDCGWTWYVTPGLYIERQLRSSIGAGISVAAEAAADARKKGEGGGSQAVGGVFGFVMASVFRLTFALVMIPIQAVVTITQKKPHNSSKSFD